MFMYIFHVVSSYMLYILKILCVSVAKYTEGKHLSMHLHVYPCELPDNVLIQRTVGLHFSRFRLSPSVHSSIDGTERHQLIQRFK